MPPEHDRRPSAPCPRPCQPQRSARSLTTPARLPPRWPLLLALVVAVGCGQDPEPSAGNDLGPSTGNDTTAGIDALSNGTSDVANVDSLAQDGVTAQDTGTGPDVGTEEDTAAPSDAGTAPDAAADGGAPLDAAPDTPDAGPPPSCKADADCPAPLLCVGTTCRAPLQVWPNAVSRANSDPWLATHHAEIRQLRPRVLALNFVNAKTNAQMLAHLGKITAAVQEASRPRGYQDAGAPPMWVPQIAYAVDLRDNPPPAGWKWGNSTHYPRESPKEGYWGFDYEVLWSAAFAAKMAIADPDDPGKILDLCALIDRGLVHEVWVYGDADVPGDVNAAEILERKPRYDAQRVRLPGVPMDLCAGNGCFDTEDSFPAACDRTVRVGWVNHTRGPGCFMESVSHGFESTGKRNPALIPYLKAHFPAFAGFDLQSKYKLPFDSWYACKYDGTCLSYPTATSVTWDIGTGPQTIADYDPVCGNVHFAPNGTKHYDLLGPATVSTSCEGFRQGGGPGGTDLKKPFNIQKFAGYQTLGQDCMGPWLIWWWQNMPGYGGPAKHVDGTPMLSWLPFVYY